MLTDFLREKQDGVFLLGHSSVLARVDGVHVLLDPMWGVEPYAPWWKVIPPQVDGEPCLPSVRECIVSHWHADHCCDQILRRVPCSVTVMSGRPDLSSRISRYKGLTEMAPGEWRRLPSGLRILFVKHPFNSVDSACFIKGKDFTVYFGNDCFLDKDQLAPLKEKVGRVDVALLGYAFVHYYPHLLDSLTDKEKNEETLRLTHQTLKQSCEFMEIMRPTVAIPIGGNIYHVDGMASRLNKSLATPWNLSGAIRLITGGYYLKDGSIRRTVNSRGQEVTLESQYLKIVKDSFAGVKPMPFEEYEPRSLPISRLESRIEKIAHSVNHRFVVNGIIIDGETHTISLHGPPKKPYTKFLFDKSVFLQWYKGEITFEQALGTRRFRYWREPNRYDLSSIEFYSKYL